MPANGRIILCTTVVVVVQLVLFGQYHLASFAAEQSSAHCPDETNADPITPRSTTPLSFDHLNLRERSQDVKKYTPPSVYRNIDYRLSNNLSRVFPIFPHKFPCYPPEPNWFYWKQLRTPTQRGFLYFKARKAGSSTVAGVALRIALAQARKAGLRPTSPNSTHCHTRYGHPAAHALKYSQRSRPHSFLWSIIREPTSRHISEFFHFSVSRTKMEPSKEMFQTYFEKTEAIHEYYLRFMSTDRRVPKSLKDKQEMVAMILQEYDFIGITERMHESLVALQMILKLDTRDLLYLSAKQNGGWDDGLYGKQCIYITQTSISDKLQNHFASRQWEKEVEGDNLLYVTVNRSLDRTIDNLGRGEFNRLLKRYNWALKEVQTRCESKVVFPCSAGGKLVENHDCILWDSGCGNDCLDQAAEELQI